MDTTTKNFLVERGYKEDVDCKILEGIFDKQDSIKKFNVSIRDNSSGMLFGRIDEKNIKCRVEADRIIIEKKNTVIMNIIADEIHDCLFTKYGNDKFEFDFEIKELSYSLYVEV